MRTATALAALVIPSLLACLGAGVEDLPTWPAEPLSLVALPGREGPTDVVLLGDGAFAASYRYTDRPEGGFTTSYGGVRFRAADGGRGLRPDVDPEREADVWGLALSPDGKQLAAARYDHVTLLPLDGGEARTLPYDDREDTSPAALLSRCSSPWQVAWGASSLALRCANGPPLVVLDVTTGARTFAAPKSDADGDVFLDDLAVSTDGRTVALVGRSDDYAGTPKPWVELRSLPDGALKKRFPLANPYGDVAISPDGARLALNHPYYGLQILDAADGRVLAEHSYPEDRGNRGRGDVVWSPDGKRIYRVGRRLSVTVHDGTDAGVLGFFPAHADEPENPLPPPADWPVALSSRNGTLALSPDERFLASVERLDFGQAVRLWRLPAPDAMPNSY